MTLREKRCLFTQLLCEHTLWIIQQGYEVSFDEGLDRLTSKDQTSDHMKNSLHTIGLAQDINLYKNGFWLARTEDHRFSGLQWETLHPLCRWGGHFNDGNHYSFEHNGVK